LQQSKSINNISTHF